MSSLNVTAPRLKGPNPGFDVSSTKTAIRKMQSTHSDQKGSPELYQSSDVSGWFSGFTENFKSRKESIAHPKVENAKFPGNYVNNARN